MSWTCLLRSRLIPGSVSLRRFYSYPYEASRQRYTLAEESSGERPRPLYFKVPSKGKSTQQKQPLASKPNRPPSASFIAASHLEPSRPAARPKAALKNRDGGYAIHAQNMSSHVQIVATPTADTAGAGLLLHFDHRRYHFGTLAQGTQRAISQRGHSLAKLDKIFIAGEVNWETTGGMLGMMLTVADGLAAVAQDVKNSNEARRKEGKREIATPNKTFEIFGGKNTAHTVATARNFIFRTGMPIKAVDLTLDPRAAGGSPTPHDYSKPDWEDDTILVWHVPVARSRPATAAAAAEAATAAGTGTRPVRKRTFDVMHNAEAGAAVTDTRLGSQSPRARSRSASPPRKRQQMAENTVHDIVENMFNSDWSKDGLFETKLADVQMPAKIFIRENGNIKKYDGPTPSTRDVVVPDITVLVRKPWPSAMVTDLPPTTMSDTSLCYVVKNRGRRGKLNPKVAIDLGVAKPDFKRLTAGETVKAMDGKDVTPDMVLEAPMKGQGFAVLAIPSLEHAPGFLERPEWQSDELLDNVQIFYWIFGKGVFDDPSIQEFIKSKPHVRHLVMGPDISPNMITYESYAALFTKLHRLDPARFPVLQFDNTFRGIPKVDGLTVEVGRTGMKAHMLPNFKINDAEISDITNLILLSRARQSLKVPFIASGGFADGQGLAAALCLGACGINMGTRFMCTVEAPIHHSIKEQIVKAQETDTELLLRRWRNTTRLFRNDVALEALKVERESTTGKFEEIAPLMSGKRGKEAFVNGDPNYGVWTAGQVIGLIHDIPTVDVLVTRIEKEAEVALKDRLSLLKPAAKL
ncbi:NADH:quinone reductase like protein [Verticillium longisporum]|nr:NADH:quinone reductase like protein [Verticillium longisporum]